MMQDRIRGYTCVKSVNVCPGHKLPHFAYGRKANLLHWDASILLVPRDCFSRIKSVIYIKSVDTNYEYFFKQEISLKKISGGD